MLPTDALLRARDFLLQHRDDYDKAYADFRWPDLPELNWAIDWFDVIARDNPRTALWIAREGAADVKLSYAELSERSSRLANGLRARGVRRGDAILLMLPNVQVLWEVMLAAIKLGAVVVPSTTQLTPADVADRLARGQVRHSMGRPLPGYEVTLIDAAGREASQNGGEGEIAIRLGRRPLGLMVGYSDDAELTAAVTAGGYYRTGDEASRDGDGYFHYVGRGDDVFKSSDYRISPFELESALLEHPAVAEAAVVPSPDPVRLSVPKAFVVTAPGFTACEALARELLAFCREKLAPYKRVRRIEFAELPKTISGKIRRVELKNRERDRRAEGRRGEHDYGAEDFEGSRD
jgi:acyl-coenzyme A synthetase/AMP-(fatty) acid ligase